MAFAVVLTVALFALSGLVKVLGVKASLEQRDALAVPPGLWRTIGVLEILGVLGVVGAWFGFLPIWLGQAAAAGFILLIVGATATRIRAKSPAGLILMDLVTLVLSVLTLVSLRGR